MNIFPHSLAAKAPRLTRGLAYVASFLIAVGFASSAGAQVVRQEWANGLDDSACWYFDSRTAVDQDGNVITCTSSGTYNTFTFVKYAPDGTPLWTTYVPLPNCYEPGISDMAIDHAGNVILAIHALNGTDGGGWQGVELIKVDRNGNLLWNQMWQPYDNTTDVVALSMAVDSTNNIFIGGYAYLGMLAKFGPDGTPLWEVTDSDWVNKVVVDSADNVYTAGSEGDQLVMEIARYDGSGNQIWRTDVPNGGYQGAVDLALDPSGNLLGIGNGLVKLDPNGNQLWFVSTDELDNIAVDTQGDAYVTGRYYADNDSDMMQTESIKFDPNGNILWQRLTGTTYIGSATTTGNRVINDPAGGVFILTANYDDVELDPVVLKFDAQGNQLWSRSFVPAPDDFVLPQVLGADANGGVYLSCFDWGSYRTWTVKYGPDQAPILSLPATASVNVGCPVTVQASAHDPEGDPFSFSLVGAPAWASIDPLTGLVTLSPPAGTGGPFNLTVEVTDSLGASSQKNLAVTVSPILISGVSLSTKNGTVTVQFTLSNTGGNTVSNVSLNSATLGGLATQMVLPITYDQLKPGGSKSVQLKFKSLPSGGGAALVIIGTSSAGPADANLVVNVP